MPKLYACLLEVASNLPSSVWGGGDREPYYDGYSGLGQEKEKFVKTGAAAMALRAACSRII